MATCMCVIIIRLVAILVFSNAGEFLRSLNTKCSSQVQLDHPFGLCVSGEYLYVTDVDSGNGNLSIFTTDGEYVTKIGKGDFSDPWDVCVDKDGFVYVCDHGNNRVQIF